MLKQLGVGQGLLGGCRGELAVGTGIDPPFRVLDKSAQIEILNLSGEFGRKRSRVEPLNRSDAALAFQLRLIELCHAVTQRRDRSHPGNDNSSTHGFPFYSHLRNTVAAHCPSSVKPVFKK